jgi:hypothetical protein
MPLAFFLKKMTCVLAWDCAPALPGITIYPRL